MPVSWDYFVRRNSIDVATFLKKHSCGSYDDLCSLLDQHDICLPLRDEVSEHFPPPPPPPRKAPVNRRAKLGIKKPKPAASQRNLKKQTTKKTPVKKKEVTKEVKDGSKQAG